MDEPFKELENLAALFLQIRLKKYEGQMNQQHNDFKTDMARKKVIPGPIARSELLHYWIKALEDHCQQIINDFIYLIEAFDIDQTLEYLEKKLDAHINDVTAEFSRRLIDHDFGGISTSSSEKNRINNVVCKLKIQNKNNWLERTKYLVSKRETIHHPHPSAKDLDDRLPVRKRGSFDLDLPAFIKEAVRSQENMSLVMIDIDYFKQVNDTHGHIAGDEVLLAVARCLLNRIAHKGRLYRYGGEEFSVLLPRYSLEEAAGLCERLRKDIEKQVIGKNKIGVTASFGIACTPEDGTDASSLVDKADVSLYKAKQLGRNRVETTGNQ